MKPALTLQEGAARLATLLPHRFIWLPQHCALRISLDGQHRTNGPCTDAFLETTASHGVIQWAVQQECIARGWSMGTDLRPHPKFPHARVVIYVPQFTSRHAEDLTLAAVRAIVNALERHAQYQAEVADAPAQ
ncbi:hypothetical protein [Deinococcus soli (ex Cha et al. 2016)]|uniref:hypothetical protein n=1 Tax=Deinococcus soli (ex Cha et al. 2016) TaxID=1309411 RepID=UPI00166A9433|nr:hypothetical protein [Deinococcus soli (ex Cha et al. 2016)]GGB71479.1 hypothetical protein GCM10008019_29550 [Deinococcus soli (ex Cha et al. 2016)]